MTCILSFFIPGSPCRAVAFVNFCGMMGSEISLIRYKCMGRHCLGFRLVQCLESTLCQVPSAVEVDYACEVYVALTYGCS